jgi:ferric-dicitrate binding protein FerR (iron transport regulator)
MSRRSFPRIDPAALRDHADDARVDRVWERIERDMASRAPVVSPRVQGRSYAYLAIAAALGAFAAGLWVGKGMGDKRGPSVAETPIAAPIEKSRVEVLAAGSQARTFPLDGGARLTLSPGATVEVERVSGALTVKLLQGEATIDNTIAPKNALAVVAGDARLNTQAGSALTVTRHDNDLDVRVDNGSVSISSPKGDLQLGKNERASVPLRTAVSSVQQNAEPRRNQAQRPRGKPAQKGVHLPKGVAVSEWLARYGEGDTEGAAAILQKQDVNAVIAQAKSAFELNVIAELMREKSRNTGAAMHALQRIVDSFPNDQQAYSAALQLASMYEASGQAEKGKEYRALTNKLAQNTGQAADALFCNSIKDQMRADPDKTHAAALAKEYLDKYPNGACRNDFEPLLSPPSDASGAIDDGAAPAKPSPSAKPAGDPPHTP